jgi:hypothetical protein
MQNLKKALKKARTQVKKLAESLPDQDAYATPYSILADMAEDIDKCLKEIGPALKESKKIAKEGSGQFPNRAVRWCIKP